MTASNVQPLASGRERAPTPAVRALDLTKRYGSFTAVDGISFEIHPGECFGLLGPNGAGCSLRAGTA